MDYPTSVELERLRTVGTVHLPQLADDIDAAVDKTRDAGDPVYAFRAVVAGMSSVASTATASASAGGGNAFDILESMMEALKDLRTAVIQEQERLRAGLQAAIDFYSSNHNEIRPSRPMIATPMELGGQTGWGLDDFYPTPAN